MTSIRRAWWAALVLATIAGCNSEESAPVDTAAPASPTIPAPSPTVTPPDPTTPPPGEMKATPPPDAPAPDASPKLDAPAVDAPAVDAPKAGAPETAAASLSDEEVTAIKGLPTADQPLALKQIVCPVSGENLGSMEKPIKVTAKGKSFFLCCSNCEKAVKSDPDAVLAKLKK